MNTTTFAIDIAKSVFQLHWVEPQTGQICRRQLTRAKVLNFFAQRQPARVAMEACGSAHHWGRQLAALGHQVLLIPPQKVRAFVTGNKDDASDARGIWLASTHGDIRCVSVKSVEQQAQLSVHRVRAHWVKQRTASVNVLRGLLYEFGVVIPKGRTHLMPWIGEHSAALEQQLPPAMWQLVLMQMQALRVLDQQIEAAQLQLEQAMKASDAAIRLLKMPGIGPLGATALAATLGDGSAWKGAREFACSLGLTPSHTGTGGKIRMGGISKRGDAYLRTLLVNGARNLARVPNPRPWIAQMLERRPFNVVVVAVAHKLARMAWAMIAHQSHYEERWHSVDDTSTSEAVAVGAAAV